jgi:hypothetical protein
MTTQIIKSIYHIYIMYNILYDTPNNQSLNKKIMRSITQNKGMGISNSYQPMFFHEKPPKHISKKGRPYKQL